MDNVLLHAEGLCKTFALSKKQQKIEHTGAKKRVAVNHLSFDAMEGEIFGLLGPNGAGKTTTLRMLATLIKPDEGDAVIGGYSVRKEAEQVRRKIGFLTSELRLEEFLLQIICLIFSRISIRCRLIFVKSERSTYSRSLALMNLRK